MTLLPATKAAERAETPLITTMGSATEEQWRHLGATQSVPPVSERVLLALRLLDQIRLGFPVTQLTHCLQAATRAERAGADTQTVVAALCHDIGKVLPGGDHGAIAAELLRPYVRADLYHLVRTHWSFQLRYTHKIVAGTSPDARARYRRQPWYPLAQRFADEWDQTSFDPTYDTLPLEHFEARVHEVFASPVAGRGQTLRQRVRGPARRLRITLGI